MTSSGFELGLIECSPAETPLYEAFGRRHYEAPVMAPEYGCLRLKRLTAFGGRRLRGES